MKKYLVHILVATLMIAMGQFLAPAEEVQASDIAIIIDGKTVNTDVAPMIVNSRTLVPVRVISENLGADVEWNNSNRTITIVKGSTTMVLTADSKNYTINNSTKTLDSPAIISNGRTMVPLRLIGEALGAAVEWENGKVVIDSSGYPIIKVNDMGSGQYLNLRSGPGTNYPVIGQVYGGAYLEVTGESGNWYKIKTSTGADAYVSKDYVSLYNNGGANPSKPSVNPPSDNNNSTDTQSGTIVVSNKTSIQGQASITFNLGTGTPKVVSNDGNKIVLEISGAQVASGTWTPAENLAPFNGFKVENISGDAVRMTANVTNGGYFRLDLNGSAFTVTAVTKHKNGTKGLAGKVIVVSAGHGVYSGGTIDRGALSPHNGLDEVAFNTPVALKLRDKLEAAGATVIMIRDTEGPINMTLYQRSVVANDNNADAFIELHGDSAANQSASGIGTWLYTGSLRMTSAAQEDMRNEFGAEINQALAAATGQPAYIKYANFSVTRETEVPCALIECGFLSNAEDAARLATDAYQEKLAQGIFNGLNNYFAY